MSKKARDAMTKARSVLVMDHPFYGCLILQLKLVEMPSVETMATDGKHLYYAPDFVLSLKERQLVAVIAHEGLHCAYKHHVRMGERDPETWNHATDYIINADLTKSKFELPKFALLDMTYDGMSSEEVYNLLEQNKPKKKKPEEGESKDGEGKPSSGGGNSRQKGKGKRSKGQGGKGTKSGQSQNGDGSSDGDVQCKDPGRMGGVIAPAPAYDKTALEQEAARWETIARQAVNVAKAQNAGTVPGYLERLVEDLERPRVDWTNVLRRFVDESVNTHYTWMRPNKRYLHSGLILPGTEPDGVHHIVSVMDTSGSVTSELVKKYASEKQALIDEGLTDKLTVIYADTHVRRVQEFERGDEVKLTPVGGGGTHFADTFNHIRENYPDATLVLYFTDLITSSFGEDPGMPVLWVVDTSSRIYKMFADRAPFGDIVRVGD